MLSVEVRVDTGGSDWIPHTFLVIVGPDGVERGYGLKIKGAKIKGARLKLIH
jgi:hypothetical protein